MKKILFIIPFLLLLAVLNRYVTWDITGSFEGIYLLTAENGGFAVTDDIVPEDAPHYITGVLLGNILNRQASNKTYLHSAWDRRRGRGFIKNEFADGRKLLVNLSRYKTLTGSSMSGIFIGGGLPKGDPDYNSEDRNETGMAYFDGKRWFHIWCYVNEGIATYSESGKVIGPEQWQFEGSRLIENSKRQLTIQSRHSLLLDGVPVEIEKTLHYKSGDMFVTIVTIVKNRGSSPITALYMYGDEPWLGNYGSSAGNVGWSDNGLIKTEQSLDSRTHSFAGFYDYGNDLAGEQHTFTNKANFIQWDKASRPDLVYFSNIVGDFSTPDISGRVKV